MAHDTAHPEPICFKPAEGREVGLVEAGLNQPGIADRHVDALLNPIGHRRLSPLRDTASGVYPLGDVHGAGVGGAGQRPASLHPLGGHQVHERLLIGYFGSVVQEGDLDSDGPTISANAIDLAGGFIRDAAGNDAILNNSVVGADDHFKVDAVAPTVSSIAITSDPGDDDTYGTGDKIEVTVTFSENMSLPISITCSSDVVHCKAELELDIGGTARTADYQSHDGAEVVYAYTVQAGDTDDNGIAIGANRLTGQRIRDAAGRSGEGINDADLSHDAVADDSGHMVSADIGGL